MLTRIIPSSNEPLPVIGLGTWQSFDKDTGSYPVLKNVLDTFHSGGGRLIDSSPMYGRSEKVIGEITQSTTYADDLFYATKVWTTGREEGIRQMQDSMALMQRKTMDLIQIYNLVDWRVHLKTLRQWKEEGRVRYIGITHYTDQYHEELETILRQEKIDFVQFNHSILARNAEKRLLPACAEQGVATLINRPLGEGILFQKVKNQSLPGWANEIQANSWAAFFLKYILSHPAVTCVIPATADPSHAADNLAAGEGVLPDEAMRGRMADYVEGL